ncbi:unnamed protein product [Anisakis simplex]|uniref:MARVEL domain-containing protein n=1 Tax=Anisakis simplex TaxID=6269 RepID=A0A0M3K2S8_ANISI|nr:unnamed protein product [Anisakis simplex]
MFYPYAYPCRCPYPHLVSSNPYEILSFYSEPPDASQDQLYNFPPDALAMRMRFKEHFPDPATYSPYYGAYGAQQTGGAYSARGYSQQQQQASPMQYRRSRTAPPRTTPKSTNYQTTYTRRGRGYSLDPYYFNQRYYRSYSGPTKDAKNMPMYRKRRDPNARIQTYEETEFGGSPTDVQTLSYPDAYSAPTMRRIRPFYAPSYTTYPPSTMNPTVKVTTQDETTDKVYPFGLRLLLKVAELIIGAAILGLVLGPMHDHSFYEFVTSTKTEWQGLVVGIVSSFSILALVMLATAFFAHKNICWQRVVLLFINFVIYIVDCAFSFRTGISML